MSLAMFAASIDDNSNITLPNNYENSDNIINQKRHKRTQRKHPKIENFDTNKVNSVLQQLHNNTNDEDDDDAGEFKLLPPPESMGVSKTIPTNKNEGQSNTRQVNGEKENFAGINFALGNRFMGKMPDPANDDGKLDLNDYNNYGDAKSVEEYYKRVMPGYQGQQPVRERTQSNYEQHEFPSQDVLLKKLNYMITLLEEKQDEKTSNVTEEVILYSFLGIFIIFIADTFVRAGKYVR